MLLASLIEVTSEYFQPNNVIQIFSAAFMALSAFMMYFTFRLQAETYKKQARITEIEEINKRKLLRPIFDLFMDANRPHIEFFGQSFTYGNNHIRLILRNNSIIISEIKLLSAPDETEHTININKSLLNKQLVESEYPLITINFDNHFFLEMMKISQGTYPGDYFYFSISYSDALGNKYRTLFYLQAGKEIQKVEHEVLN